MKRFLPSTAFLFFLCITVAYAQEAPSNTKGLYLNGHIAGAAVSVEDEDAQNGGGGGIRLGYGISPIFTLYAGVTGAVITVEDEFIQQSVVSEEVGLAIIDLGAQFNFGGGRKQLVPYLDLSLSGLGLAFDVGPTTFTAAGGGLSIGGGLKYFLSETVALDGGLHITLARLTDYELADVALDLPETDASAVRFNFGLSWFPLK